MSSICLLSSKLRYYYDLVLDLKDRLEKNGYKVDILNDDSEPEESGTDNYSKAMKRASSVICLVFEKDPSLFFEIGYAVGMGKNILILSSNQIELPSRLRLTSVIHLSSTAEIYSDRVERWLKSQEAPDYKRLTQFSSLKKFAQDAIQNPKIVQTMDPIVFEDLVKEWFEQRGFRTEMNMQGADYGYDFQLPRYLQFNRTLVVTKMYSPSSRVSISIIQQLFGCLHTYHADCGVIITTSSFTSSAIEYAERFNQNIELWTLQDILEGVPTVKASKK